MQKSFVCTRDPQPQFFASRHSEAQGCLLTQVVCYPEKQVEIAAHLFWKKGVIPPSLFPHHCSISAVTQRRQLHGETHWAAKGNFCTVLESKEPTEVWRVWSRSVYQGQGLPPVQVTKVELIQHIPTLGKMSALLPLIALWRSPSFGHTSLGRDADPTAWEVKKELWLQSTLS